jgi:Fic family protein
VHFELTLQVDSRPVIENLARIHALAGVIRGIPIPPSVQRRLDRLNTLRAVQGTTGIEGTEFTEEELSRVLDADPGTPALERGREREEQEARNAGALMRYVAEYVNHNPDAPISEQLILRFHEILTQGIDYPNSEPGRYRNHPVNLGFYRPPANGEDVRSLMAGFVRWLNTGRAASWDPVIPAIVAHFYFVIIHPFGDGNGRTSRAVESFLFYKARVNARGYYSLANYFYRNRQEYADYLSLVQMWGGNDLTPFVVFALNGLVQELDAVHNEVLEVVKRIAFRDYAREFLKDAGRLGTPAGERQLHFLTELSDETVSLRELRSGAHRLYHLYRGVNTRTLMRDINYFKDNGLIIVDGDELRAALENMTQFTA